MQAVNIGAYVDSPKYSICCCFSMRLGLKLAVFAMGLGTIIGIIQTYGLFVLYSRHDESADDPSGYNDQLNQNMVGFGPDICFFIILCFRLAGVFGAAMTAKWAMKDNAVTREHLANGFLVMLITQWFCGITEFMAVVAQFSLWRSVNFGILSPGHILPFFFHEIFLLYAYLKARKYADLADTAVKAGFNFENAPREFELPAFWGERKA